MFLIRTSFILCFALLIASCGGNKSGSSEIIFPDHLPKVNPNLSQKNQSGIWMVYRVTTESSEYTNDDGEIETLEKEIIANELGTIILDTEHDYYNHYLNCTPYEFSSDDGLYIRDTHENGYMKLYRDNLDEEYGSSGRIHVSYLSSQKIYGKGWKTQNYWVDGIKTGFHQEIEFFAVKVSDEDNFLLSDDLKYSSVFNSEESSFDEDRFYGGMCLGLQEHNYSSQIDNNNTETGSYKFQYFQHHVYFDRNFEIYNGKSKNSEEHEASNNQVIGVLQWYSHIDNYCLSSDLECVNKYSFQSEILQNDSSGISFTAKLTGNEELNNEVYIDTQVSVIIYPFEAAQDTEE
jgi:hypothetical protein